MRFLAFHPDAQLMLQAEALAAGRPKPVPEFMPPITFSNEMVSPDYILQEMKEARLRLGFLPSPGEAEQLKNNPSNADLVLPAEVTHTGDAAKVSQISSAAS